jgi:hypothetical protein
MKISNLKSLTAAIAITLFSNHDVKAQAVTTQSFFYTGGAQSFTIPHCASNLTIEARGAQGGSLTVNGTHLGGLGAIMSGVFSPTPTAVLTIIVGQRTSDRCRRRWWR